MKAVGIHVFAGGFTTGVQRVMPVDRQLEIHGLGTLTVNERLGIPVDLMESWEDWPSVDAHFAFGNPRCTGFSYTTTLMSHRGPDSPINKDIHDFCQYVIKHDIPVAAWESVQQAYSLGRPLLDFLRDEYFLPNGYRIAHVFVRAANFGNSQLRRRYFFVAYKNGLLFNAELPQELLHRPTIKDVIGNDDWRPTIGMKITRKKIEYDADCYLSLKPEMERVYPYLAQSESLNTLFNQDEEAFDKLFPDLYEKAMCTKSTIPFGIACPRRLAWSEYCPTLTSGCCVLVHPEHDRTLTIRELSKLMGWPHTPVGAYPIQQIAKGIVPAIGEWLARQVKRTFDNEWEHDWEETFGVRKSGVGKHEKVLRLEVK